MWINLMVATISQYIHISKHLVVYLKYIQFLFVRYTSIFTCQIYLIKGWGKGGMDLEEPCFLHNTLTGHSLRISFFEREHQGTIWRLWLSHITAAGGTVVPVRAQVVRRGGYVGSLPRWVRPWRNNVPPAAGSGPGGSGPVWGPTKSNTANHHGIYKNFFYLDERWKRLGLYSPEELHTCDTAASFYLQHC